MKEIVFASNNAHKLREMREILGESVSIRSLADIGCTEEIPETSDTLAGNAVQKAKYVKERYGHDCFADDTGLMVEALGGAPGVYTARYAGDHCSPADNIAKMLREMKGMEDRRARFATVIAYAHGDDVDLFEGSVEGTIATSPHGTGGFGYDPIFIPLESGVAFAEMAPAEKNLISHRGRAVKKFADHIINHLKI